ncbi:MAG: hypothetical protein HYU66_26675 [Armatimonadetes bacterium]|nr:hypothetical protein [Armatimonadota bacterium]
MHGCACAPGTTLLRNELCGWIAVTAGLSVGALLGLRFQDEQWLGGYTSFPRRMLRLGHIACTMLGVLNLLFAGTAPRLALSPALVQAASWGWLAGAVLMPATCFLAAREGRFGVLFPLPVACLLTAAGLTILGVWP